MALTETIVYERGDHVYLVAPASPLQPEQSDIEEYAFGKQVIDALRSQAPSPHIAWFGGHYVEADHANGNGAMWTAKELALKQLTPMFMPVTVMHDPRTAVGLIAHAALLTPEGSKVPRAKIETALACWQHRFPDVVEEAHHNYRQGSLMQSMECLAPAYSCAECGLGFVKLPHQAERANWCSHLKGTGDKPPTRILAATTFTGTGLIFGSRGASGADPLAHLDDFQQEVAEFHQRVHTDQPPKPRRKSPMEDITLTKAEYDELRSRPTREELEKAQQEGREATAAVEKSEAEASQLKARAETAEGEVASLKEQANKVTLRDERLGKLGEGFKAKLGEKTSARLSEQATSFQDDEWASRLEELEEAYGVKADAPKAGDPAPAAAAPNGSPTFKAEETARFQVAGTEPGSGPAEQGSVNAVMGGLMRRSQKARNGASK